MLTTLLILAPLLLTAVSLPAGDEQVWWSLRPLEPAAAVPGNPVDFHLNALRREQGLPSSPPADRRTLLRRVSYDLTGLPPTPEEVAALIADPDPDAYEKTVDRLLASPRYGERWARHWLDVVHYGDSHGYDKDQPRPNAWPYRDYVIRAFNEDRPWARFVEEQIAGDILFPDTRDGVEALGFLSAGPWDLIGHTEVAEDRIDGKIARHLDRDDMVANTINTFCSVTVHCAQCHDHKFDPVPREDYYALQAVFSALDRTDRPYDSDPQVSAQRRHLQTRAAAEENTVSTLTEQVRLAAGDALTALDRLIAAEPADRSAAFGWHSEIASRPDDASWVQLDFGSPVSLDRVILHPCHDDFNGIGDGFGFPLRYQISTAEDPEFRIGVRTLVDRTSADVANPGVAPVPYPVSGHARYLRITATRLAPRQNDWIFALAECEVMDSNGINRAAGTAVSASGSIKNPPRWQLSNLTDGVWPGGPAPPAPDKSRLRQARKLLMESVLTQPEATRLAEAETDLARIRQDIAALPAPSMVYCATVHTGSGAFSGTGASGGKPRPVHVLARGDVTHPGPVIGPGTLSLLESFGLSSRFTLPDDAPEGARRAALARWISDSRNPLTWRSIVNRVWLYHFGRGLVDTPGDFGKMGDRPGHPALLDWLAADFRDHGGSLKRLHRLIVTSAAYQQSSSPPESAAAASRDAENRFLWRMNRRKLEAEAVRDSLLLVAGALDLHMGGPPFRDFVMTHPEHSPHYEYHLADLADPALHRRAVYRFLARSKPQPWMATLDCADPSLLVDKRSLTITPLQALAQLNNPLVLVAAERFADRVRQGENNPEAQVRRAWQLALQRDPSPEELRDLTDHAAAFGLASACRVLLNLNEFNFAD